MHVRAHVRAACLLVVAAVLTSVVAVPPATAATTSDVARTALVVDVVDPSFPTTSHVVLDSTGAKPAEGRPGAVAGSLRVGPPVGASGPLVELLPADSGPLAVGTYAAVPGQWQTGARPQPVLRLVSPVSGCTSFVPRATGLLVVHDVQHDATGAVTRLSASYRMSCDRTGAIASGDLRHRSPADYAAAGSSATWLGTVVSGSRTPFTARITNGGTTPLTLGAPTWVERGADAPRLEVTPSGDTCSAQPVAVGATCRLSLEYVDDGVAGGGHVAELRLAAPALPRGHVSVLATVQEVVRLPGQPQSVRTWSAYDGVALSWSHDSGAPIPDGWRVRRIDGASPGVVASLPIGTSRWADTSLSAGESATYEVVAHNAAGEVAAPPVTVARQDRPDPPPAVDRRVLTMDGLAGSDVADSAAGTTVTVSDDSAWRTRVTGAGMTVTLPLLPGPGRYRVGTAAGDLSVSASGPPVTCSSTTGTAEVREAWVGADARVHRLDADLHLLCAGIRVEVALRLGTGTGFPALTASPASVADLQAQVGGQPATREVRLRNAGTEPVDVGRPSLTGESAADFSVADTCGPVLQPGSSCGLTVAFAPRRSGAASASLEVPVGTAIGVRRVALSGDATGAPPVRELVATAVLGRTGLRWYQGPDGGSPVTAFVVQRAVGAADFATVARLAPDAFGWTDPDVTPGATYRYRLLTENAFGSVVPTDAQAATVVVPAEELLVSVADQVPDRSALASVPVEGGVPVRLADDEADLPTVSPDGRQVAYSGPTAGGDAGLWVRPLDGSAPARLLVDAPDVAETDPAWSPDGSRICYSHLTATSAAVACVPTAPGGAPAVVPGGAAAMEPSWLPDGSGLLVTDLTGDGLRLARLSSAGQRSVLPGTEGGSRPAVSPRGDRVAFVLTDDQDVDHLRVVGLAGGTPTDLATSFRDVYDRPSWAPDGQALAVPAFGPFSSGTVTVWRAGPGDGTVEELRAAAGYDVGAVAWRRQDVAAPTIAFPGAAPSTGSAVTVPVRVVDDTVPVGGLSVTCTVDGRPVPRCTPSFSGALPAGPHRLVVTATDPHGRTATAAHTWTVDTAAPTVAVAGLPGWTLTGAVTVAYSGSDAGGIASYDVRYRRAAWAAPGFTAVTVPSGWAATTSRSRTLPVTSGQEYCFSVRARDRAGNLSAWSAESCTAVPLDDRALARTTAGWSSAASSTALAGTLTRTSTGGARLVRTSAQARRLALVATTCPTCGSVEVLVGSTRVAVVSLVSPTTRARQVLALPPLGSVRAGTVTVRSLRTGRPVLVDGLGLRKT